MRASEVFDVEDHPSAGAELVRGTR